MTLAHVKGRQAIWGVPFFANFPSENWKIWKIADCFKQGCGHVLQMSWDLTDDLRRVYRRVLATFAQLFRVLCALAIILGRYGTIYGIPL